MEIKVLGTVSPWPKDNSNCPGFLITENDSRIMLDCGFGSTSLLDKYKDLKDLTVIISHYHPDHYGDLFALGNATFVQHNLGFLDKKVEVIIPEEQEVIKGINSDKITYGDKIEDYNYIMNTKHEHYFDFSTFNDKTTINAGGMTITFYKTIHALNAHAIKIESESGVVVYSSDTDYDEALADFAKYADVFICEASFLNGQVKGNSHHLYASEAGKLARLANVKNLYLYHTYPELDKTLYLKEALEEFPNTHNLYEKDIIRLKRKI